MRALVLAAGLLIAEPVGARAFEADQLDALLELSGVLGESHALRQACKGEEDQFWRSRMIRLLDLEKPPLAEARRLKAAFNEGYMGRRQAFSACTPAAREAEAAAAARGQALARRISAGDAAGPPPGPDAEPMVESAPVR